MGKKKREEKLKKKLLKEWEEKRPKTFREALKYFPGVFLRTTLVMVGAVAVILMVNLLGLKVAQSFWFQLLVYLGFYLAFQRFIMGPLAPPRIK
ncbi:hypothetical protein [Thermus amyloliquefaciens]|uniref:hypothetical protein n=1 Tax=Thermus amyloliquefaciens TaxID=1449080 RepID=UPI00056E3BF0|nr:hypothetical protein [Thermus amyloliquefaciens]